jgi:hypothetical protein
VRYYHGGVSGAPQEKIHVGFPTRNPGDLARGSGFDVVHEIPEASMEKLLAHIKDDQCERCLAVYRQLDKESSLICYLMQGKN